MGFVSTGRLAALRLGCVLALATSAGTGCSALQDFFSGENPRNCLVNPEACGAGEQCNPTIQACEKATPPDGSISDAGMQDAAAGDGSSSGSGPCTWKTVPSSTAADLYGLWGSSATDVWAGGTNGTIAWTN